MEEFRTCRAKGNFLQPVEWRRHRPAKSELLCSASFDEGFLVTVGSADFDRLLKSEGSNRGTFDAVHFRSSRRVTDGVYQSFFNTRFIRTKM